MAHLTLVRAKTHYQQLCSCEPTIAKPASHTWSVVRSLFGLSGTDPERSAPSYPVE